LGWEEARDFSCNKARGLIDEKFFDCKTGRGFNAVTFGDVDSVASERAVDRCDVCRNECW
jgi:hypothetical protein